MIIGLSGKAGVGKDTVANILVEEFGYKRVAFADKIKECLLALDPIIYTYDGEGFYLSKLVKKDGWDYAKQIPEVRRLLQRMGTEVGRELIDKDLWVDKTIDQFGSLEKIVVADVRFSNEAQKIQWSYASQLWRIERDIPAINSHSSETELDGWEFDKVISNNGTLEELAISVREEME